MPQKPQQWQVPRQRPRRDDTIERSEGADGKPPTPGVERLYSTAPVTIENHRKRVANRRSARLATVSSHPKEDDAFETSTHCSCEEWMQCAACVQIPGSDAPIALALPEQRVDLGGLCAVTHVSDQLPDDGCQPVAGSPRHTRHLIKPGFATAPREVPDDSYDECPGPEGHERSRRASCEARHRD